MGMTPYNQQEYNRLCAEFLGGIEYIPKPWYYFPKYNRHYYFPNKLCPNRFTIDTMKFHSDWNWIHMIKEEICKTKLIDEFNTTYDSVAKGWNCHIFPAHINTFNSFRSNILNTEKEAVVETIWKFLQWYNEQK
jgi:hypothetical protein